MTLEDLVIVPTKCAECPLWHESGYGTWCGHPKAVLHTESDPFAILQDDGTWRAPDWNDEDQMPERCPLKRWTVILKTGAATPESVASWKCEACCALSDARRE